ncbi:MAG: phytase [Mariniblastus sp.]
MKNLLILGLLVAAFITFTPLKEYLTEARAESRDWAEDQSIVVASAETEAVQAEVDTDAADDSAIWYCKENPSQSLVIGTDKKFGLNIYDLNGKKLQSYKIGELNNVDVRQDVFDSIDIVGASNRTTIGMDFWMVQVHNDLPKLTFIGSIKSRLPDVYGFCLGMNLETNEVYGLINSKTGKVEQWKLSLKQDKIEGELQRELRLQSQVEGMAADDKLGRLYVGVEEAGIYRFELNESEATDGTLVKNSTEANSEIKFDIEGLTIYEEANGNGYLVASIQGNNSFAVFERAGDNAYVGSFKIMAGPFDGVQETDGVHVTSLPLGPRYPKGMLVCQDGENFDGATKVPQNFKYVSWELIAKELGLK